MCVGRNSGEANLKRGSKRGNATVENLSMRRQQTSVFSSSSFLHTSFMLHIIINQILANIMRRNILKKMRDYFL